MREGEQRKAWAGRTRRASLRGSALRGGLGGLRAWCRGRRAVESGVVEAERRGVGVDMPPEAPPPRASRRAIRTVVEARAVAVDRVEARHGPPARSPPARAPPQRMRKRLQEGGALPGARAFDDGEPPADTRETGDGNRQKRADYLRNMGDATGARAVACGIPSQRGFGRSHTPSSEQNWPAPQSRSPTQLGATH